MPLNSLLIHQICKLGFIFGTRPCEIDDLAVSSRQSPARRRQGGLKMGKSPLQGGALSLPFQCLYILPFQLLLPLGFLLRKLSAAGDFLRRVDVIEMIFFLLVVVCFFTFSGSLYSSLFFLSITISPPPSLDRSLSVLLFAPLSHPLFSSILPFVNPFPLSPSNFFSYLSCGSFFFSVSVFFLFFSQILYQFSPLLVFVCH